MPRAAPENLRPGDGLYPVRYHALDAFRGLAALAVVVHHVVHVPIGGPAVMVFFVISGYCIAAAGDACRDAGLGGGAFMLRRVRRIFPPYLLSLAFWAATRGVKAATGKGNDLARPFTDWLQNLTLTQWVTLVPHPSPYPGFNTTLFVRVYWSLCYEEQFYLVMALTVAAGLSAVAARWLVVGLMGVSLAWCALGPTLVHGVFIEYWAMFGLGCLAYYRLCVVRARPVRALIDAAIAGIALVAGVLVWRAGGFPGLDQNGEETRFVAGELLVCAVFAGALIALRPYDGAFGASTLGRPVRALGKITFSLYLVHQFNLAAVRSLAERLTHRADSPIGIGVQIALHLCVATAFWWACERPFLNRPLKRALPRPGDESGQPARRDHHSGPPV